MKLNDIIAYEQESTYLDFKLIQYPRSSHESLIKDIIAMANANTKEERLIVCGVKFSPGGHKEIVGIDGAFIDSSTYEQLIHENIEPSLDVSYFPELYEGKILGIFKIPATNRKPYLMKKDFGSLRKGEGWIRKGSHQSRLVRADIEEIYEQRYARIGFNGEVECVFTSGSTKLQISIHRQLQMPSQQAKERIESVLQKKQAEINSVSGTILKYSLDRDIPRFGGNTYEDRSIATLKENLKSVKNDFLEDDHFYLYSKGAHKIRLIFTNRGNEFLEDCSVEIVIPKIQGFYLFDQVFRKPYRPNPFSLDPPPAPTFDELNYPEITKHPQHYLIMEAIGNLKHNLPACFPQIPFRILLNQNLVGETLSVEVRLHAKNLPQPKLFNLMIECI
jgi:hypothetical protein